MLSSVLCFVVLTTFAFALLYGLYQGTQWMCEVYAAMSAHRWRAVAFDVRVVALHRCAGDTLYRGVPIST